MSLRYDGFVFIDQTTALSPLIQKFDRAEIPETCPRCVELDIFTCLNYPTPRTLHFKFSVRGDYKMPPSAINLLRKTFSTGATRSCQARLDILEKFEAALESYENRFTQALFEDLGKSYAEAFNTEIGVLKHELAFARKNIRHWMRPRKVPTPLYLWPARSEILQEPRGVVLIIGAWNYPVQLVLAPLIGALAAGNCVIVKPSEVARRSSSVLKEFIETTFPPSWVQVFEGGVDTTTKLLKERFDLIFFTGSTRVGRIIYEAAAKTLTPVILELGGKSPAIVCEDADIQLAARRIVWGKFMNAGQTCIAPDHVYAHSSIQQKLILCMKKVLVEFYGEDPKNCVDFGRIINTQHFDRLNQLITEGTVVHGGGADRDQLFIAPTLLTDISPEARLMKDEIFGPLLPILSFENTSDLLDLISKKDKPLAAYLFTQSETISNQFLEKISFGGACINDAALQFANPYLPFGGVGTSGIGSYHGEKSFQSFSHAKSLLRKSRFLDLDLRYPPFSLSKVQWLQKIVRLSRWLD